MNSLTSNSRNSVRLFNPKTGQTSKILSIDGDVTGVDSNGSVGIINAIKGNSCKTYVVDLNKGFISKLFSR